MKPPAGGASCAFAEEPTSRVTAANRAVIKEMATGAETESGLGELADKLMELKCESAFKD